MTIQALEYGVLVTIGYHPRIIEVIKKIGGGWWNSETLVHLKYNAQIPDDADARHSYATHLLEAGVDLRQHGKMK